MVQNMRRFLFALCAGVVLYSAGSEHTHAQPQPPLGFDTSVTVLIQDTLWALRIGPQGDTLPASWYAPAYQFDMQYDSACTITYLFTECKRNGTLWKLAKWWDRRIVNANPRLLSYNSRTVPAVLHAGDTISFFRYAWWSPQTEVQDTNNYFAPDSLDYAVELVRTADSMRIALVDSIGFMPNMVPARPVIHGTRPLMALARYRVPEAFDGTEAFLRVLLYHRGPGPNWFTRSDQVTVYVSNWLNAEADGVFGRYIRLFQPGMPKYSTPLLDSLASRADAGDLLNVAPVAGSSVAAISFASAPDGGSTTVAVYDEGGHLLFMPYLTASSSGPGRVEYRFEHSGAYFVALLHGGAVVATRRVVIVR